MKNYIYLVLFLVIIVSASFLSAEELSLNLIPSEDELFQLLITGEISFEQYQNSQEIFNLYNYDDELSYLNLYNLSWYSYEQDDLFSDIEEEQSAVFNEGAIHHLRGSITHKYSSEIEKKGRSHYRSALKLDFKEIYKLNLKIQKEYSGRERITYRNLIFNRPAKNIKKIIIGNFIQKYGLGGVYGYRGKLFDYSSNIDDESLLFPDYGGYNGYFIKAKFNKLSVDHLMTINRDSEYSLNSFGLNLGYHAERLEPYLTVGYTQLKNRTSSAKIDDLKIATGIRLNYNKSYLSLEAVSQAGYQSGFSAILGEGVHRFTNGNLKYSFWHYDDDYLDLTGGGKAVYLTSHIILDTINFEYSDRRVGQSGGSVRSTVKFMPYLKWSNSLMLGVKKNDSLNAQYQSELAYRLNRKISLSFKHLVEHKKRVEANPKIVDKSDNRFEIKYVNKLLSWRSYLAYRTKSGDDDYLALFGAIRYHSPRFGSLQLWLNLYQVETGFKQVDSWYAFLKNEIKWYENWFSTVKLSHTYNRRSDNKDITTLSMELIRVL